MSPAETRALRVVDAAAPAALDAIRAAIRQPSVSRTGEGVAAMADHVALALRGMGATARLVPGQQAPIVEGTLEVADGLPTLLFYDLYDVQPAERQPGWSVPPFAAALVPDAAGRTRLIGRGAFNSKGPLFGALAVFRALAEAGALPCNLRFLIEGEEEIGSPSLPGYIRDNHAALAACDAAFIPYFGTDAAGVNVLRLGFKGLALLEFRVTGGAWGGPARGDVHALHGALLNSPAWELVRALATLVDGAGRLTLDGLGGLLPRPDPDSLALIDAAAPHFDAAAYRATIGVARFRRDASSADLLRDLMLGCTPNLDALQAGRIEEGEQAATLIPRTARALADLRVVPGITAQTVLERMRAHLDRRGFAHVEIVLRSAYPASACAPGAPVVRALTEACRQHAASVQVFPIHAGAAPMYLFSEEIGIPYAFGGVGHGGGAHGPDEFILADDLLPFMRSVASFLFRFAEYTEAARCPPT